MWLFSFPWLIAGHHYFLDNHSCICKWEKWDGGAVNGCTLRKHLAAGVSCDIGDEVWIRNLWSLASKIRTATIFCQSDPYLSFHLQFLHICATSGHMGKLHCLLCHQLLYRQYTSFWNVHHHVSPLPTTVLLDNTGGKLLYMFFAWFYKGLHAFVVILCHFSSWSVELEWDLY